MMCVACVFQRGQSGDLFVLNRARVRRLRRGSISLELLMCGGGVRSIFPLVARCMYMVHVCFISVVVTVWGSVGMVCCVAAVVNDSVSSLGVLKYVVCLCKGCDGCCVFCLYCEAWSCRCSCMGNVIISSSRCCMRVSCVHPVVVLNTAFYMTCSLLILVEDGRGDHIERQTPELVS